MNVSLWLKIHHWVRLTRIFPTFSGFFFFPIIFIPLGSCFQMEACKRQGTSLSCYISARVTAPPDTSLATCASWDGTCSPASSLVLSHMQHARLPWLGSHIAVHPPLAITPMSCLALERVNYFYLLTKHLENCFGPGLSFSVSIHPYDQPINFSWKYLTFSMTGIYISYTGSSNILRAH